MGTWQSRKRLTVGLRRKPRSIAPSINYAPRPFLPPTETASRARQARHSTGPISLPYKPHSCQNRALDHQPLTGNFPQRCKVPPFSRLRIILQCITPPDTSVTHCHHCHPATPPYSPNSDLTLTKPARASQNPFSESRLNLNSRQRIGLAISPPLPAAAGVSR